MCTNKIYKYTHLHRPATNSNIFMYIVNKIMFLKWKKKGGRAFFFVICCCFFSGSADRSKSNSTQADKIGIIFETSNQKLYGDNFCFEQIYPYSWKLQSLIRSFTCTSDNTYICYGKNNGFTTKFNDWQEKHIFVYLVDFVQLQILQFLQGHPKKSLIL